jgi:hypothetical protein
MEPTLNMQPSVPSRRHFLEDRNRPTTDHRLAGIRSRRLESVCDRSARHEIWDSERSNRKVEKIA